MGELAGVTNCGAGEHRGERLYLSGSGFRLSSFSTFSTRLPTLTCRSDLGEFEPLGGVNVLGGVVAIGPQAAEELLAVCILRALAVRFEPLELRDLLERLEPRL